MSAAGITAELLATRVASVLRDEFGQYRDAAKKLARAVSVTPRTAENWLSATNAPRAAELVRLMAENEAVEAEVLSLVRAAREGRR